MKKYFLSIVALAGMLFATSCQESLVEPQVGGPTTFTVQVPDQMGTKADGDSYKLFVEVYSADGSASYHRIEAQDMAVGTATTVTLNLVANQEYDIIFWAQKNADSYGVSDLSTVQMNDDHHNSETGAAFYAVLNNYNPTQGKKDVKLTRPFAQLNLYTTNDVAYGKVNLVKSTITIEGAAEKFNRVNQNGETFGEGVGSTTYTYTSDILPTTGTKEIGGVVYQYVSMDYLAVPGNQNLVKVTAVIDVRDEKGNTSQITRVIDQVPVQMNYRTNIIGNLITSASDFKVEISEDWAGEDKTVEFREVSTAAELQDAITDGVKEIVLVADIELDQPLMFGAPASSPIARASATETPSFVLDLGGKTITTDLQSEGRHYYAIDNYANLTIVGEGAINARGIQNFGTMTIDGDITITNVDTNGGAAIWNEGAITINNGTFTTNKEASVGSYGAALNTRPRGNAIVNGGNFIAYSQLTYAIINEGETIINNAILKGRHGAVAGTESSVTKIYGGSFELMENPGVSDHCTYYVSSIYGGQFTLGNNTDSGAQVFYESNIADGYQEVLAADGKTYVVLPATENYDIVITDPAQLTKEVLTNYDNILLQLSAGKHTIDLYMAASFDANLTIIGTKGTKVEFAEQQVMMALVKNFTIKNCEILHMATKTWGMLVFGGGNKADGVYTIENCTFNGVETQGIYINEGITGATYNIINCTFNGDFGGEGAITIQTNKGVNHIVNVEGCEFNNIPETSHRIFLAPNGGLFYDFTLNTDLKATTAYELEMFLALGQENVVVANDITIGKINLTNRNKNVIIDCNNKTITTTAEYGVVINAGQWSNVELKNANIVMTYEGNYITYAAGFKIENGNYTGKTIELDNCTITMANTDWAYAINMPASVTNLDLVVNKCSLTGAIALQCWGDYNEISINESELICNYTTSALYTSYCMAFQNNVTTVAENNILNVEKSKFDYQGVDKFNSEIKSIYNGHSSNTISVSDCIYEGGVIE